MVGSTEEMFEQQEGRTFALTLEIEREIRSVFRCRGWMLQHFET